MNAEIPPTDSSAHEPAGPPPGSPKPPWLLLIGVLLGAVFMSMALYFTSQAKRAEQQNSSVNAVTVPTTTNAAGTPSANPTPASGNTSTEYSYSLFVPNDAGDLVRREAKTTLALPAEPDARRAAQAELAVRELMKSAPDDFPRGAELQHAQTDGETIRLSFNNAFTQPDFWQGSTRTLVTAYSIVNTAVASVEDTKRVQFLIEGQPVEVLGPLDTREPLEPDQNLVVGN